MYILHFEEAIVSSRPVQDHDSVYNVLLFEIQKKL